MWGYWCGHGYQYNYSITIEPLAQARFRLIWNCIHKIALRCKDGRVIEIFLFFIKILTFSHRKYKYYFLYFSLTTLYPSFIKKSCLLCGNSIIIYIINRTLHGRLGIRILSSRAKSISHSFAALTRERYFLHSKIKFVWPRGHVISPIYTVLTCEISSWTFKKKFHIPSQPCIILSITRKDTFS